MTEQEARKEYTKLLKFCGIGYYKKIESGKAVDPVPENLLYKLDTARSNWIELKTK